SPSPLPTLHHVRRRAQLHGRRSRWHVHRSRRTPLRHREGAHADDADAGTRPEAHVRRRSRLLQADDRQGGLLRPLQGHGGAAGGRHAALRRLLRRLRHRQVHPAEEPRRRDVVPAERQLGRHRWSDDDGGDGAGRAHQVPAAGAICRPRAHRRPLRRPHGRSQEAVQARRNHLDLQRNGSDAAQRHPRLRRVPVGVRVPQEEVRRRGRAGQAVAGRDADGRRISRHGQLVGVHSRRRSQIAPADCTRGQVPRRHQRRAQGGAPTGGTQGTVQGIRSRDAARLPRKRRVLLRSGAGALLLPNVHLSVRQRARGSVHFCTKPRPSSCRLIDR
ncbi:hypothetical protein PFISCL1PPCAC_16836, partial [Pristionchus fissidentatus]